MIIFNILTTKFHCSKKTNKYMFDKMKEKDEILFKKVELVCKSNSK